MSQVQSNLVPDASASVLMANPGDEKAIRDCLGRFVAAWNKHDPRQMSAC
jgi:hypothetical protein